MEKEAKRPCCESKPKKSARFRGLVTAEVLAGRKFNPQIVSSHKGEDRTQGFLHTKPD